MADEKGGITPSHSAEHPSYDDGARTPAKRTKRQSCARHCKRFWWVHLIIFICIVVLVVCLVIFVGVPKIAQDKINEAELEVQGINVLQTKTDSYLMEINSTITSSGGVKADIDAFTGEMYLEDLPDHTPFSTVDFPKTNSDKHQVVNISQEMTISDHKAFNDFNIWFYRNESIRVTVSGKTKVKPAGLPRKFDVDFKKTLTLKGLNRFHGTKVTGGHISLENDDDGNNFNGTAEIPNASVFTLDIGNATFANFVEDDRLGTLKIEDLVLVPGTNNVNITANMRQVEIVTLIRQPEYCQDGVLPFKLLGENVTNHGQDIDYFAAALASANQTVEINIGRIIANDLNATVGCAGNDD